MRTKAHQLSVFQFWMFMDFTGSNLGNARISFIHKGFSISFFFRSQPYAFSVDGSSGELVAAGVSETETQGWMYDIRTRIWETHPLLLIRQGNFRARPYCQNRMFNKLLRSIGYKVKYRNINIFGKKSNIRFLRFHIRNNQIVHDKDILILVYSS